MTIDEAIICLKGIKNYGKDTFNEQTDWQSCLDMAIESLRNDNINDVLDDVKAEIKEMVTFENVDDLVNVTRILDKHKRGRSQN